MDVKQKGVAANRGQNLLTAAFTAPATASQVNGELLASHTSTASNPLQRFSDNPRQTLGAKTEIGRFFCALSPQQQKALCPQSPHVPTQFAGWGNA
jgi:hypothetical protein